MIKGSGSVTHLPRFYESAQKSQQKQDSLFSAHLLSSQALFSSRPSGAPTSTALFENRMLHILNEISRHMSNQAAATRQNGMQSPAPGSTLTSLDTVTPLVNHALGTLSAQFESGNLGVEAVGYDQQGGTSYGRYQLSSRAGTMDRFISYLGDKAPEWASRLEDAGPADTGSRQGRMPDVWKDMAAENPILFGNLQHAFIRQEFYNPARDTILETSGYNFDEAPVALQEVLWSTAVQHGPTSAAQIFHQATDRFVNQHAMDRNPQQLIREIFSIRSRRFGSSTPEVQDAVKTRFNEEQHLAFDLLKQANSDWNG